jgi:hypothetical protein
MSVGRKRNNGTMKIGLFSCGGASAINCYMALKEFPDLELYYTKCGGEDEDGIRFLHDCEEKLFHKKVNILQSPYKDHFEVFEKYTGYIGKNCKIQLKIRPFQKIRYENEITHMFVGFTVDEKDRLTRYKDKNPDTDCRSILIEKNLTKANCHCLIEKAGIQLPRMYKLGFANNNCIGCPEGGAWYWNHIRKHFPENFKRMAELERKVNFSILKGHKKEERHRVFLDELPLLKGRPPKDISPQCSLFCNTI